MKRTILGHHQKSSRQQQVMEKNKTPNQVEGRKAYKKKYGRTNNLHPKSIAMENPHFIPELILPTGDQPKIGLFLL